MAVRVLVAGSSSENADLARAALTPLGCEVSPVTSISLGLYLAHKTLPDLIVSAEVMADGTGLDLLRELKADEELKEIPFVFICATADNGFKQEGLAAGANKVISRKASVDEFVKELKPYLRERKQWRKEESPE